MTSVFRNLTAILTDLGARAAGFQAMLAYRKKYPKTELADCLDIAAARRAAEAALCGEQGPEAPSAQLGILMGQNPGPAPRTLGSLGNAF